MADDGIFATSAEIGYKAGAGKNATAAGLVYTDSFITQAESYINAVTRFNWSDAYAALSVDIKGLLKEAGSNIAAIYVIQYDMSGYSSSEEAQLMINVLWARADVDIKLLMDYKVKDFIEKVT